SLADDRRQQLLEVASQQFARQGRDLISMESIALAAGVTRTAIYYYFPTKADLVRAVLMRSIDWRWWNTAIAKGRRALSFSERVHILLSECVQRSVATEGDVYFALVN